MWKGGSERRLRDHFVEIRVDPLDPRDRRAWEKVGFRISETILSENDLCKLRSNINRTFILLRKTTTSFCKCSHLSSNLLGNFVDFREIDYSIMVFISFSPRDDDFCAKTCKNARFSMIFDENR